MSNFNILSILQITGGRGNNLHEVETSTGEKYLASMPTKFRKNIWIKRGCYVVVEPIEEGKKVKAEIVQMLLKDQIKYFKSEGKWPQGFTDCISESDNESGDENSDDLLPNPNRPDISLDTDSSSDSDDDTQDDEEDEDEDNEDESGASSPNQTGGISNN